MELAVKTREMMGKSVKALRAQGIIPAELYGRGIPNVHLAVGEREFAKVFSEAGENTVIQLVAEEGKLPAIVHDVQRDPISLKVRHIDFYQVRMDEKIKAYIPIEFAGEAPAVKSAGGILNKTLFEIEVEALPGDLPHRIPVDLAVLQEVDQSIYIKDIAVPKGVHVIVDPETVVVTVTPQLKEEEPQPAAVDVSAVKVETEEKKADREKEKTESEPAG